MSDSSKENSKENSPALSPTTGENNITPKPETGESPMKLTPPSERPKLLLKSKKAEEETGSKTEEIEDKSHLASSLTGVFKIGRMFRGDKKEKAPEPKETSDTKNTATRVILSSKPKEGITKLTPSTNSTQSGTKVTKLQRSVLSSTKLTKKSVTKDTQSGTQKVLLRNSANSTAFGLGYNAQAFQNMDPDAKKILLVDDEVSILKVLSHIFRKQGYAPITANTAEQAIDLLAKHEFDLVISDLRLGSDMDGLDLLNQVKLHYPTIPVLIITGYASVKIAIQALKNGAFDLVTKPFKMDQLSEVVENALTHSGGYNIEKIVKQDLKLHFGLIVGEDEKMKNIYNLVKRISKTDATVLVQGEPGTETNEFAKIVHHCSRRNEQPFIKLSGSLVSQEHVNSSIIYNMAQKANGGTLYLQDLELFPADAQQILLDLITSKTTNDDIPIDIRLVVSSSTPLKNALSTGAFSKDLYYKMCAFSLDLPPLRQRIEDIPLLINYFCYKLSEETGEEEAIVTDQAINILLNYSWPGNIDELQSTIRKAAMNCKDNTIQVEDIDEEVRNNSGNSSGKKSVIGQAARKYLQQQVSKKSHTENISLKIKQDDSV